MIRKLTVPNDKFEWYDIQEPVPAELEAFGREHKFHPYTLRDCLEPDHLPKFEKLSDGVRFVIFRQTTAPIYREDHTVQELTNKIAIFYDEDRLVTVHRKELPYLKAIHNRIHEKQHPDEPNEVVTRILWYALDTYDNYLKGLMNEIDNYENTIFIRQTPPKDIECRLYFLKRKASVIRDLLEMTGGIMTKMETTPEDASAMQDVRDLHARLLRDYNQVRDDVVSLLNMHLSLSAQRTNDVMKVLTIFSAFFLPLTFIVGIYGMNFDNMPELRHPLGYFITLIVMGIIALVIYMWFKRKHWL